MAFQITRTKTNDVYHKLIDRYVWMVEWGSKKLGIIRSNRWWESNMVQIKWLSRILYRAKVFTWRVMGHGLPLGVAS